MALPLRPFRLNLFNDADDACPLRHQQRYLRGRTARVAAQRARIDLPAQGRVVVLEDLLRGERLVDDLPALHPDLLVDPATGREQVLDHRGRLAGVVYPPAPPAGISRSRARLAPSRE